MDLAAPAFGLAAALAWGAGDFAGGLGTRRAALFRVSVPSQLIGLAILLLATLASGEALADTRTLVLGALAGLAGAVGLGSLYAALAAERMGVAAPITAVLSAAIPTLFAGLTLGFPSLVKLAGFALALAGIWYLARPESVSARPTRGVALALLSGVGFGLLLTLLGLAGEGGTWWPLVAARAASAIAMLVAALVARQGLVPTRTALGFALLAGTLDVIGNVFYVYAAQVGRLDVAAVLASLYPMSTVLLARLVLHERLTRTQAFGAGAALVAVVLISGPW